MSKSPQQTALAVAEAIKSHPDHFDMDSWAVPIDDVDEPNYCNTSFCIAGWALAIHGYKLQKADYGEIHFVDPESGDTIDPAQRGADLLGLRNQGLFYNPYIDVDGAVELLRTLASEGEDAMYDQVEEWGI